MTTSEVFSVVAAILASLGGGGVIILGLSGWLGKVWANSLMEAEKAKHMRDVEAFKASIEQAAEDRTRKLEALMRHYERQIEEFYGPLFNMVNQILYVAHDVQRDLISGVPPEKAETIRAYYREHYFDPIHDRIREILNTRLYLVEGEVLPETFEANLKQYLRHTIQERDQRALWLNHRMDTSFLAGVAWPWDLHRDIRAGFETAMRNYQQCLEGLKA